MDMLPVVSVICVNITYDSTYNYIESLEQVRVSIIIAMKTVGNALIKSKLQHPSPHGKKPGDLKL